MLHTEAISGAMSLRDNSANEDMVRPSNGAVIINADDWGLDAGTTNCVLDCVLRGVVSSVSAMMFMEDSKRGAELARKHSVDIGLHLNLTARFSAPLCSSRLRDHQQRLSQFLRAHSLAPAFYHPGLATSFEYVVKTQMDEFERLYGASPKRIDGHHHMHLCANVQFQKILPAGTIIRRNFSFARGEKSTVNRLYRHWQDRGLARRHRMTDFFFALPPLYPPASLEKVLDLTTKFNVELECHPANPDEYWFLISGEFARRAGNVAIARGYNLQAHEIQAGAMA